MPPFLAPPLVLNDDDDGDDGHDHENHNDGSNSLHSSKQHEEYEYVVDEDEVTMLSDSDEDSAYSAYHSIDRLSTIWEEETMGGDYNSIGTNDSINLANDVSCLTAEPKTPYRNRQPQSPSAAAFSSAFAAGEYSESTKEWMSSFFSTRDSEPSMSNLMRLREMNRSGEFSFDNSLVSSLDDDATVDTYSTNGDDNAADDENDDTVENNNDSSSINNNILHHSAQHEGMSMAHDSGLDSEITGRRHLTLMSVKTGEEVLLPASDDEFTFISGTTGDDDLTIATHEDDDDDETDSDDDMNTNTNITDLDVDPLQISYRSQQSKKRRIKKKLMPSENPRTTTTTTTVLSPSSSPLPENDLNTQVAETERKPLSDDSKIPSIIPISVEAARTIASSSLSQEQTNTQPQHSQNETFPVNPNSIKDGDEQDRQRPKLSGNLSRRLAFELSRKRCQDSLDATKHRWSPSSSSTTRVLQDEAMDPLKRQLSYFLNRKKVEIPLLRSEYKLRRPAELHLFQRCDSKGRDISSLRGSFSSPRTDRNSIMKKRHMLELFSGQRRRYHFEKSKRLMAKKFIKIKDRLTIRNDNHKTSNSNNDGNGGDLGDGNYSNTNNIGDDDDDEKRAPIFDDAVARFGGLQRRESYKKSRRSFERKFEASGIKELLSSSPRTAATRATTTVIVDTQTFTWKRNIFKQQNDQERPQEFQNWGKGDMDDDDDDHTAPMKNGHGKHGNAQSPTPAIKQKGDLHHAARRRKLLVERYGGVRRRDSFKKSRERISSHLDKMNGKKTTTSKTQRTTSFEKPKREDLEHFAGIQRSDSYKRSKKLFQQISDGSKFVKATARRSRSDKKKNKKDRLHIEETQMLEMDSRPQRQRRKGGKRLRRKSMSDCLEPETVDTTVEKPAQQVQGTMSSPSTPQAGKPVYELSRRLKQKRLQGELARKRLQAAFDDYQHSPVSRRNSGVSKSPGLKEKCASFESLVATVRLSPKPRLHRRRMNNATKRLQEALHQHELIHNS